MAKFTLSLDGPLLKIPSNIKSASFDYVSRYQLIGEIIHRYFEESGKPKNILDVGGLGTFLDKILSVPLTIFDSEADGKTKDQDKGDGARMVSIKDGSFDVVVTSDTLEHIPGKDRRSFVHELVRASNDLIILCAPFSDHGAAAEEVRLQEYYENTTGNKHRWLKEHKEFVLPKEGEVEEFFKECGVSLIKINHNAISIWEPLLAANLLANEVATKDTLSAIGKVNRYYNETLLFKDFETQSYRTFFVASKKKTLSLRANTNKPSIDEIVGLLRLLDAYYSSIMKDQLSLPKTKAVSAELQESKRLLGESQEQYRRVVNSASWRVTQPLRTSKNQLHKLKKHSN